MLFCMAQLKEYWGGDFPPGALCLSLLHICWIFSCLTWEAHFSDKSWKKKLELFFWKLWGLGARAMFHFGVISKNPGVSHRETVVSIFRSWKGNRIPFEALCVCTYYIKSNLFSCNLFSLGKNLGFNWYEIIEWEFILLPSMGITAVTPLLYHGFCAIADHIMVMQQIHRLEGLSLFFFFPLLPLQVNVVLKILSTLRQLKTS